MGIAITNKNDYKVALYIRLSREEEKIESKQSQLDTVYMDKLEGKISEEMYTRISSKLLTELEELKKKLKQIKTELETKSDEQVFEINYKNFLEKFINMETPTRDMMLRLIDRVEVHKDKQIDIYFNFKELNNF